MPKGNSGIKRGGGKGSGTKAAEPTIRGVPQSQIDQLRGERDHQLPHTITWQTIQEDYKRVGITITDEEARFIHKAVEDFSFGSDWKMRKAKSNQYKGKDLRDSEKQLIAQYDAIAEYCQVAPILPQGRYTMLHRGIKISTITPECAAGIMGLKPGDTWDVDRMPTSFSTSLKTAHAFSHHVGKHGIVVHMPTHGMKNSPSIRGISLCPGEDEVMVTDYGWKVTKVEDNLSVGGYYEITVEHI